MKKTCFTVFYSILFYSILFYSIPQQQQQQQGPPFKMPEQIQKRIQSLQQENTVLKMELETYKLKCKNLQEENRELRKASVNIVSSIVVFVCLIRENGVRLEFSLHRAYLLT